MGSCVSKPQNRNETNCRNSPERPQNEYSRSHDYNINVIVGGETIPTYVSHEDMNHWMYRPTPPNPGLFQIIDERGLISLYSESRYLSITVNTSGVPEYNPSFNKKDLSPDCTSVATIHKNQTEPVTLTWFACRDDPNDKFRKSLSFSVRIQEDHGGWRNVNYHFVPGNRSHIIERIESSDDHYVFNFVKHGAIFHSYAVQIQIANYYLRQEARITHYRVENGEYERTPSALPSKGGHEAINVIGRREAHIRGSFMVSFELGEFKVEFDNKRDLLTVKNILNGVETLYSSNVIHDVLYAMISISPSFTSKEIYVIIDGAREQTYTIGDGDWCYSATPQNNEFTVCYTSDKVSIRTNTDKKFLLVEVDSQGVPKNPPRFIAEDPSGSSDNVTKFYWDSQGGSYYALWFDVKDAGGGEKSFYLYPNGNGEIWVEQRQCREYIFELS